MKITDRDTAYAEMINRQAKSARSRLLAKGKITVEQSAFMDRFDADALAKFKVGAAQ